MSEVNAISNVEQMNEYSKQSGKSTATGSSDFSSYLEKTKSLDDIFDEAAKKYNVSAGLLKAIGKAESDFDANAVSKCGAQGIMQLMPATAASLGVKDSFDAEQNIMGGAKYISELMTKYDGDTSLALAAYNAGMGNVAKYGGIPPFEETQNYVVKVTNFMKQGVDAGSATATIKKVAPVTVPTTVPITSSTGNQYYVSPIQTPITMDNVAQNMNAIFSEQDYMNLLDIFMDDDEKEKEDNS